MLLPFSLLVSTACSQGNCVICDTTEVCICHDGSAELYTYVFIPCQPGQRVTLAYCCGIIPDGSFVSVFDGVTIAAPVLGIYALASAFGAQQFAANNPTGALTLRVSYSPTSTLNCASGDYPPLVIGLYSGLPQPPPPPPVPPVVCPLPAVCCLTTGVHSSPQLLANAFTWSQGAMHCSLAGFVGETELYEASGRLLESHRWRGETVHPVGYVMSKGAYLLVLRSGERTESRLLMID